MAARSSADIDHITSEPQSIASLIEGQGDVPLGVTSGGDEDQAALLTYLKTHYADASGSVPLGNNDIASLPTATYRPTPGPEVIDHKQSVGPSHNYIREPSPPNVSIPIPPSLAAVAAQSQLNLPPFTSDLPSQPGLATFDERGEMGGKRRKLPHERAGWKEMDDEPKPKRKRGGRRSENATSVAGHVGNGNGNAGNTFGMDMMHQSPGGGMSTMGLGDGSLGEAIVDGGALQSEEHGQAVQLPQAEQIPPPVDSKESRAAQNRRAQQVFRRKREEKMRELEADAAGYQAARQDLASAQLQLEAEHIEKMALRLALRNLSQSGTGISILDSEGNLLIQSGIQPRQGQDTPERIEKALDTLEAQCRELAKVNRSRRI